LVVEAGPADPLVTNARASASGPFLDCTVEQLDRARGSTCVRPWCWLGCPLPDMVARGRGDMWPW